MQRFRNILVGVDLSHADRLVDAELNQPTRQAIKSAVWLAGMNSAQVTFFSTVDLSAHTQHLIEDDANHVSNSVCESAQKVLNSLVQEAKAAGVEATCRFELGPGWLELIKQVQREKHDLLIVGTRDLGSAQRLLFGSTAMKLIRKCPCPVWVTKPRVEEASEEDEENVLNVLVASDLSEVSADALQMAVSGGQLYDIKLHLLHAFDNTMSQQMQHTGLSQEMAEEYSQKMKASVEESLKQQLIQTDFRTLTYGVQTHVINGPPEVVIPKFIEDHDIDLLVMGTIGRTGISGFLIGNTAEKVLPEVHCSLLAVKPHDFQSPIQID
jgi:universal stress protein E